MRTAVLQKYGSLLLIALAVLAVAVFTGGQAVSRALWTDDLYSLTTAEESPGKIISLLRSARPNYFDHPPLYFLVLHSILHYGNSPLLLRSISLICVALAAALCGICYRRWGGSYAGAVAVVLGLILHPLISWQAINVRMYAMFLLFATGATMSAAELFHARGRSRIGWAALVALFLAVGLYTSYFMPVFIVTLIAGCSYYVLTYSDKKKMAQSLTWLSVSVVVAAVFFTPWAPVFFRVMQSSTGLAPVIYSPWQQLWMVFPPLIGSPVTAVVLLVGFITMLMMNRRVAITGLVMFGTPLMLLVILSPRRRELDARYVITCVPVMIVCAVAGWEHLLRHARLRPRIKYVIAILLVIIITFFQHLQTRRTYFRPVPDWWYAAKIIEQNARPGDTILTGIYLSGEAILYHLRDPDKYKYIHYLTDYDSFSVACRDPRNIWHINAAPMPPDCLQVRNENFPYHTTFEGNAGLGKIEVYSKRPFKVLN